LFSPIGPWILAFDLYFSGIMMANRFGKTKRLFDVTGHTLIELVIVMVIISIMAGLASAGFTGSMSHLRLNHAVRTLVSDLRWARQLAIAERRPVQLVLDPETDRYDVERVAAPGIPVNGIRDLRDRKQGYGDIDLVRSTGGATLVFQPNGTTTDWTTLTLRNERGEERAVSLILTGRVKIK
jgi:prepilin-type N-terminal cleavage/methylation domain-containing protein